MFALMSYAFPYEKLTARLGYTDKNYPRNLTIVEGLQKHQAVTSNISFTEQQKKPVTNMWEGLDRFSKTYELNGNLAMQQINFNQDVLKFMAETKETFEKF